MNAVLTEGKIEVQALPLSLGTRIKTMVLIWTMVTLMGLVTYFTHEWIYLLGGLVVAILYNGVAYLALMSSVDPRE
jgi:hypothetical protein